MRKTRGLFAWALLLPLCLIGSTAAGGIPGKEPELAPHKPDKDWGHIGDFKLKDGRRERLVKLYYADTDRVPKTGGKKRPQLIPNFFDLYALYQDDSGKWIQKDLLPVTRVGYDGVRKATPEAIVLVLYSKAIIDAGKVREPSGPYAVTISFKKGMLTAK